VQALSALSLSDANTTSMVRCGVLDLIGDVLNKGAEIAAGMGAGFPFLINRAREAVLRVLLNLALSDKTVRSVIEHDGIRDGMVHAGTDRDNLTTTAASLLDKVRVRLKMLDANEQHEQGERGQALKGSHRHVMISYCWEQQEVVLRIKAALSRRGYVCWLDVEQMSGSTVDAMADAIDHSYAVIYGISLAYKESANCRLEAMYAHQAKVKMIPMLLHENYTAKGWLGMLLGTQLWYGFFGSTLTAEGEFDKRIQELCRALGSPKKANRPLWNAAKEKLMIASGEETPTLAPTRPISPPTSSAATIPTSDHRPLPPPPFTTSTPTPATGVGGVQIHASSHPAATHFATPTTLTPSPASPPGPTPASQQFTPTHSFISHESGQGELGRARETIARLEDRQHHSFCEELSAAKAVARLESELNAKDRELVKMEAEMKALHAARLNDQLIAAVAGRHVAYAGVLAVVITTTLAGIAVWRR
jgi:hypothetical protein